MRGRVRFVPLAIFCAAEDSTLFDHQVGDSPEVPVLSAFSAAVSSSSAINIAPEIIDHGYRPRPYRRGHSCVVISRASRRDAHLEILRLGRDGRFYTKGLISDPVGKAKSVVFTDDGLRQSEALFRKLFAVEREV
jgi:hypothetical protein